MENQLLQVAATLLVGLLTIGVVLLFKRGGDNAPSRQASSLIMAAAAGDVDGLREAALGNPKEDVNATHGGRSAMVSSAMQQQQQQQQQDARGNRTTPLAHHRHHTMTTTPPLN